MASEHARADESSEPSELYTTYVNEGVSALRDLSNESYNKNYQLLCDFDEKIVTQTEELYENHLFLKHTIPSFEYMVKTKKDDAATEYAGPKYPTLKEIFASSEQYQNRHPYVQIYQRYVTLCKERKTLIAEVIYLEAHAAQYRQDQAEKWYQFRGFAPTEDERTEEEDIEARQLLAAFNTDGEMLKSMMQEVMELRRECTLPEQGALDDALEGIVADHPDEYTPEGVQRGEDAVLASGGRSNFTTGRLRGRQAPGAT